MPKSVYNPFSREPNKMRQQGNTWVPVDSHNQSASPDMQAATSSDQFHSRKAMPTSRTAPKAIVGDGEEDSHPKQDYTMKSTVSFSEPLPDAYAYSTAQEAVSNEDAMSAYSYRPSERTNSTRSKSTGARVHWPDTFKDRTQHSEQFALPGSQNRYSDVSPITPIEQCERSKLSNASTLWPHDSPTSLPKVNRRKDAKQANKPKASPTQKRQDAKGYWGIVKHVHQKKAVSRKSVFPGEGDELWRAAKAFRKRKKMEKSGSQEWVSDTNSSTTLVSESGTQSFPPAPRQPPSEPDYSRQSKKRKDIHRKESIYSQGDEQPILASQRSQPHRVSDFNKPLPDIEPAITLPLDKFSFRQSPSERLDSSPRPYPSKDPYSSQLLPAKTYRYAPSMISPTTIPPPSLVRGNSDSISETSLDVPIMPSNSVRYDAKRTYVERNKPLPPPPPISAAPVKRPTPPPPPPPRRRHNKSPAVAAKNAEVGASSSQPRNPQYHGRFVTFEDIQALKAENKASKPHKEGKSGGWLTDLFSHQKTLATSYSKDRLDRHISKSKISRPQPLSSTAENSAYFTDSNRPPPIPGQFHPLRNAPPTPKQSGECNRSRADAPSPAPAPHSKPPKRRNFHHDKLRVDTGTSSNKKDKEKEKLKDKPSKSFFHFDRPWSKESDEAKHNQRKDSDASFACIGVSPTAAYGYEVGGPYDNEDQAKGKERQKPLHTMDSMYDDEDEYRYRYSQLFQPGGYYSSYLRGEPKRHTYSEDRKSWYGDEVGGLVPEPLRVSSKTSAGSLGDMTDLYDGVDARVCDGVQNRDTRFYQPYDDVLHEYQG